MIDGFKNLDNSVQSIVDYVRDELLREVRNNTTSTSGATNLMKSATVSAWSDALEHFRWM